MAINTLLTVDGLKDPIRVLDVSWTLSRSVDDTGRPSGETNGGIINITIEITDDVTILTWMCSPTMMKKGKISFSKRDSAAQLRALEFENAYCIGYSETGSSHGGDALTANFTISAEKITIGAASHKNPWPKNT